MAVISILLALALASYGTARYYSQSLILFVVEQTLIQRSPDGTDPARLRHQLETHLAAFAGQDLRMERLLSLSMNLEKVQALTPAQLDELLK